MAVAVDTWTDTIHQLLGLSWHEDLLNPLYCTYMDLTDSLFFLVRYFFSGFIMPWSLINLNWGNFYTHWFLQILEAENEVRDGK